MKIARFYTVVPIVIMILNLSLWAFNSGDSFEGQLVWFDVAFWALALLACGIQVMHFTIIRFYKERNSLAILYLLLAFISIVSFVFRQQNGLLELRYRIVFVSVVMIMLTIGQVMLIMKIQNVRLRQWYLILVSSEIVISILVTILPMIYSRYLNVEAMGEYIRLESIIMTIIQSVIQIVFFLQVSKIPEGVEDSYQPESGDLLNPNDYNL